MVYARTTETTMSRNVQNFLKTARKDTNFQAVLHLQMLIKQYKTPRPIEMQARFERFPARKRRPLPGLRQRGILLLPYIPGRLFFALRAKTCYCPAKCWKCISRRSCFHDDVLIKPCYSRANGDLTVGHYKSHFSTTTYL